MKLTLFFWWILGRSQNVDQDQAINRSKNKMKSPGISFKSIYFEFKKNTK